MDVVVRHNPSFAAARVTLEPSEQLRAESGAMMATSAGVSVQASTQGGVLKGLKRSFLGARACSSPPTRLPLRVGGWTSPTTSPAT